MPAGRELGRRPGVPRPSSPCRGIQERPPAASVRTGGSPHTGGRRWLHPRWPAVPVPVASTTKSSGDARPCEGCHVSRARVSRSPLGARHKTNASLQFALVEAGSSADLSCQWEPALLAAWRSVAARSAACAKALFFSSKGIAATFSLPIKILAALLFFSFWLLFWLHSSAFAGHFNSRHYFRVYPTEGC